MLARCVLLEVPLRKLVEELGLEGPADNDWSTAQLLCHFMKPFQVVTDYLQGEKYPTLGSLSANVIFEQTKTTAIMGFRQDLG